MQIFKQRAKGKMPIGFDDSFHNLLTRAMLNQEEVFRNQVLELHRLYQVQKILMKELDLKVNGRESLHSFVGPFSDHQRIPLNLELPASHYTNENEDPMSESHSCFVREDSAVKKHSLRDDKVSSIEELKLSLTWEESSGKKPCKDTVCLPTPQSISLQRKLFSCHEDGLLDLNKALPEESSVSHNDFGEYGEHILLTALDWRKQRNSFSDEPSASDRQDITNSTLTTNSSCPPSSLPDITNQKMSMPETNDNKNKEEPLEYTDSNKSPVSCKSDWTADDISNDNKTGRCGFDKLHSDIPSIQQNVVQSVETKHPSSDEKKQELEEVDILVRKGAVSLIHFSLQCSDKTQDHVPELRKRKQNSNEVPESSAESYESIVLRQPECSVDDYCVSSTPSEVTAFNEKDHGVKLRRGRRMKDFRKEILPGLVSLSRQEICEDVKIMELAIRSREYKKYRKRMASRNDCFSSVRSRRSRHSYVSR